MSDNETTAAADGEAQLIHLLAGQRQDGEIVYEDVEAAAIGDGCYRLLKSPVFARGAAKDDTVRLFAAGQFAVENHGGNLCVRVMAKADIATIKQRLQAPLKALEAQLDFENNHSLVYNIHVKQGFDKIEAAFSPVFQGRDDAVWLYSNVYDPVDGETPLNWWHDYLAK